MAILRTCLRRMPVGFDFMFFVSAHSWRESTTLDLWMEEQSVFLCRKNEPPRISKRTIRFLMDGYGVVRRLRVHS